MTIRAALQSEIDRLTAEMAGYDEIRIALQRAEKALAALDGKTRTASRRRYERTATYNHGGLPKRIMDWIKPGEVVSAERVADALGVTRTAATVALNRLCNAGKLVRVEPGRFVLAVEERRSA